MKQLSGIWRIRIFAGLTMSIAFIALLVTGESPPIALANGGVGTTSCTLATCVAQGGAIATNPPAGTFARDTEITINAIADPGYEFSHWASPSNETANPFTLRIGVDLTVCAVFEKSPPQSTLSIDLSSGNRSDSLTIQALDSTGNPAGMPIEFNPDCQTYPVFTDTFPRGAALKIVPAVEKGRNIAAWSGPGAESINYDPINRYFAMILDRDASVIANFSASSELTEAERGTAVKSVMKSLTPSVEFALDSGTADEDAGEYAIDVELSEPATTEVRVDYILSGGTATDQLDFRNGGTHGEPSWEEDFSQTGSLDGWGGSTTGWSVSGGYLENTGGTQESVVHELDLPDFELTFLVRAEDPDTAAIGFRLDGTGGIFLNIDAHTGEWSLTQVLDSVSSELASASAANFEDWTQVYIRASDSLIEVWRKEAGSSAPMEKVLRTNSAGVLDDEDLLLGTPNGAAFDDIALHPAYLTATDTPQSDDSFDSGGFSGWIVGNPDWTAENYYLETTPIAPGDYWGSIGRSVGGGNMDLLLSYERTLSQDGVSQLQTRSAASNWLELKLSST
ncbi:MAG: hypothetical protein HYV27_22470 [Candidatus Hydrogenedentes bacterium]|nr:hypothetical protein [Candidatus Hydrogenedentota bacterium]